jgi:ribosome recycling factor
MSDEIKGLIKDLEAGMDKSIDSMESDFYALRTGRASTGIVEKLQVEYFGTDVPLLQLANCTVPEAQTIMIKPFDPTTLKAIEKAILTSDLKLTPNNDGKVIRLNIPPLTQERRRDIVKLVHKRMEEARVAVRNQRRDGMDMLKEMEDEGMISEDDHKRGKEEVEAVTKRYNARIDEVGAKKEREVMDI